ncbi:MAG: LPS export ABC transporter periplasmic protein LptC [Verrucomicrobia bacterium]|nr:LPS export ABC transporter periplasmic protein LptC [Verrucomicrobiota bacterium]
MKLSAKLIGIFLGALVFGGSLRADKPKTQRKIEIPIPIGRDVIGLRLPVRNEQGKMQFMVQVEKATRLDQVNIAMQTSTVQTYDEQTSAPGAKVELQRSVLNTETNIVTSHDPVVISRDDFRLTGDGLVFNTKTRQGKVTKNIKLIIFNRDEMMKKKSPDETSTPSEQK